MVPTCNLIEVFADPEALAAAAAERVAVLAAQALVQRGVFRLALSGGRTPRRCYEHLCHRALDWSRIEVYFSDERCLPRGDSERNDVLAYEVLLRHVPIPQVQIHVIPAEQGPVKAAEAYARLLDSVPPLDLVLLGMGEDGHTASLFPDHPALSSKTLAVPVFDAPKPPASRVSLSLDVLNAARHKMFLVTGVEKHEALQHLKEGVSIPAAQVVGAQWFVDRAALLGEDC
ncbi:MAG: 6-phosphogluconolactonase [Ferrovum sp.]|nr:6-phosphogluconolactonase [Ferrovum sp.]